ncbi:MAG: tRNA (adenosine(37)-N6)-threonylcarbamoyltransferase complex ATPase subunit type 1 TsaE [Candidatus Obscuribacterales bacterium]
MHQLHIESKEGTEFLGSVLARQIGRHALILLHGQLGAGKTALVQAVGRGLGVEEAVTSPTFTLLNEYDSGRLPLIHIDLYRVGESINRSLDLSLDLFVLEFEELLAGDSVIMIEWPEFFIVDGASYLEGLDRLEVKIERGAEERMPENSARNVFISAKGPASENLLTGLINNLGGGSGVSVVAFSEG